MTAPETELEEILKGTSRAFYLSLAVLPTGPRSALSLAYLLARAADTIADTPAVSNTSLLIALQVALATAPSSVWAPDEGEWRELLSNLPEASSEKRLLARIPQLLALLDRRSGSEATAIRKVVTTLIDGMLWDQRMFALPGREAGLADEELERYTYLVAGCVGPFWSRACAASEVDLGHLAEHDQLAVEFGKGLQWVNILRDIPADQRLERYYLPDLSAPNFNDRFRSCSRRALAALRWASGYPLLFPRRHLRHRMAVLWPLLLGLRTLEKLWTAGGPRPGTRVKVQRLEVLLWVILGPFVVASDTILRLTLSSLWQRAERQLTAWEESTCETSSS